MDTKSKKYSSPNEESGGPRVVVYKVNLSLKSLAFVAACVCLCYITYAAVKLESTPEFDQAFYGVMAILQPEAYSEYAHLTGLATVTLRPFAIAAAIALGCVILLTVSAGRRGGSRELHMSRLDSVYSDILTILLICFCAAFVGANLVVFDSYFISRTSIALPLFCALITAICAPCVLAIWLSLVRKIKAGKLLRHTLVFAVIYGIFRAVRGTFRAVWRFFVELFCGRRYARFSPGRALFVRQRVFLLVCSACAAGFVLALLARSPGLAMGWTFVTLCVIFCYVRANNRTFEDIDKISEQICRIQEGDMGYDPGITGDAHLAEMSRRLLGIGSGMQVALDSRLASERMKIALVTNVSHDLKTPLTSIIGYIDLLRRDESLSGEARDYVTILAQKSQRLKTIIDDLFDLAKTTSGDSGALDIETLDLRRLIEQTLADMDDKISGSSLIVRTKLPQTPVLIRGDGRKLYRVIQNIVDNALKYSMPGTRIYISLAAEQGRARVSFKNTASYEMSFTADEILERFVRGDKSRSTEGSGLGLSIAAGFTGAMQGEFDVEIDGDQFTITLTFALTEPAVQEPGPEPVPDSESAPLRSRAIDALRGKLYHPHRGITPKPVTPAAPRRPSEPAEAPEPVTPAQIVSPREAAKLFVMRGKGGEDGRKWSINISIDHPSEQGRSSYSNGEQGFAADDCNA